MIGVPATFDELQAVCAAIPFEGAVNVAYFDVDGARVYAQTVSVRAELGSDWTPEIERAVVRQFWAGLREAIGDQDEWRLWWRQYPSRWAFTADDAAKWAQGEPDGHAPKPSMGIHARIALAPTPRNLLKESSS